MLRRSLSPHLSNGLLKRILFLSIPSNPTLRLSSSSSSSSSETLNPPPPPPQEESDENLQDSQPTAKILVDRSGLFTPPVHCHNPSSDSELVKHLKSIIKFRGGPISVAEYMEEVLTNPNSGFYINRDVFGAGGDFITSPEVSQMFGEMVGVWAMCLWEQMGQPEKVNLIELGPGRGTLMADLLRGSSKKFTKLLHIHMVECSPTLQNLQYKTLKCVDEDTAGNSSNKRAVSTLAGTTVSWHATLNRVPSGLPTIILAHEFYDALPVHQFQNVSGDALRNFIMHDCSQYKAFAELFSVSVYALCGVLCRGIPNEKTSRGWCEKMVDVAEDSSFRFVLSPETTPAELLFLMKRCKWASTEEIANLERAEVCPEAMNLTRAIARRLSSSGGGALIIDYGRNGIVSDSLQAIRKHKFVDILDNPGSADLSAYVDFASIRHSAEEASENVSVHGPISQAQFLGSLGINFRVETLLQNCTDEQAESLRTGYWRLVGDGKARFWEGPDEQTPIGVGTRYSAMAIVNKKQGVPVPFQ